MTPRRSQAIWWDDCTHMLFAVVYIVYNNLQIYHIIWSWLLKVKKKRKIKYLKHEIGSDAMLFILFENTENNGIIRLVSRKTRNNMGICGLVLQSTLRCQESSSNSFSSLYATSSLPSHSIQSLILLACRQNYYKMWN